VTVLEPVVDPVLKGKHRRHAAGAALYGIMSDLVFRTTSTGRTVVDAVVEGAKIHGFGRNFTAGAANILAACAAAEVSTIVTARAFVGKGKLDGLVAPLARHVKNVYLEDVRKSAGFPDRLRALFAAKTPLVPRNPDNPAAILFTSGSKGLPKGVLLSYRNILANAAQAAARIDFRRTDKVFNVLPVFHSFGLTAGLVLPLV